MAEDSTWEKMPDRDRLEMIKRADPAAIEWLYKSYSPRMYEALMSQWGDEQEVLDSIQQAFMRLVKSLSSLKATNLRQVHAWLLTAADNHLKDRTKSAERKRTVLISQMNGPVGEGDVDSYLDTVADSGPSAESLVEYAEFSEAIRSLLDSVGSLCAQILKLFCCDGVRLEDIAGKLSMTIDQVKKRKAKCIRQIAQIAKDRGFYPGMFRRY